MNDQNPKLEPSIIVIFGITGDLSRRYLLPALYHLIKTNLLDPSTRIIGVTRGTSTVDDVLERVRQRLEETEHEANSEILTELGRKVDMFQMDLDDPNGYQHLLEHLNLLEEEQGVCMNRLYYLSIPPPAFPAVVQHLGEQGLNKSCQHGRAQTRLLVEKPFGYDFESAQKLVQETGHHFPEDQIFRIDHYMAKETVQNILTFRFKNPIFESLWGKDNIAGIEISAKEKIGIEGRAVFYEPLGALRDFIQSHLIQILGIITMDQPDEFSSDAIHRNKQIVLDQVEAVPVDKVKERVMRGQYDTYRQEVDNPSSVTETFAAVTVYINNTRWEGVPIKLVTGKGLDERKTEVKIIFKGANDEASNQLRFRIQPNEGIELDLVTKKPGLNYEMQNTVMDFSYSTEFMESGHPNAYERVLVDAIRGDHTLFATGAEVLASWRIVQPILDAWSQNSDDLQIYQQGSAGPSQQNLS